MTPLAIIVLLGAAHAQDVRAPSWAHWAREWEQADADIAARGNDPERLNQAMKRRDGATVTLRRVAPSSLELVEALRDESKRRLALVAIVAMGGGSDEVFEAVLGGPFGVDAETVRLYKVRALRQMTERQCIVFGGRVEECLLAETSPRVLLEALPLVRRLVASIRRELLARYFEVEDPGLARFAFAVVAQYGDEAVRSLALLMVEGERMEAVGRLCAQVTSELPRSTEICNGVGQ